MGHRFPPLARLATAALILGALSGCQAGVRVALDLDDAAAGTVEVRVSLDEAARERVGDLSEFVDSTGLAAAGWLVDADKGTATAHRQVSGPADVEAALADLTGAGGPFSGLRVSREGGFLRTTTEIRGRVDFRRGLAAFGDDGLTRLTGSPIGVDAPASVLALSMKVDLDGRQTTNAPGGGSTWTLPLGQVTEIRAESTDVNLLGVGGAGIALLAGAGLAVFGVLRRPGLQFSRDS